MSLWLILWQSNVTLTRLKRISRSLDFVIVSCLGFDKAIISCPSTAQDKSAGTNFKVNLPDCN